MSFILYKSSAGSGKTYTLVKEYIKLVVENPEKYKNILGITFTNKTANEMKEKIITTLKKLARNEDTDLLTNLKKELNIDDPDTIKSNCQKVLKNILHNYSDFAITTIDSFIYRIVKSFSLELNLPFNFEVDMNKDLLIERIVDNLIEQVTKDKYIKDIIIQFIESKLETSNTWNFEKDIMNVSEKIFDENSIESLKKIYKLSNDNFKNIINHIFSLKQTLISNIQKTAKDIDITIKDRVLGENFCKFIKKLSEINDINRIYEIILENKTIINVTQKYKDRYPKNKKFINYLKKLREDAITLNSVHKIHQTIYSLALIGKVKDLIEVYKKENNVIPISDFNQKVNEIIDKETVPFIYWKIGEKYQHYLIDEFQDTSHLQWNNLYPLIENSLGYNNFNLAVGDAKQAIYRWRGGDVNIMENNVPDLFSHLFEAKYLETNYRSRENIIEFNNFFFAKIADVIKQITPSHLDGLRELYKSASQKGTGEVGGYIRINIIEEEEKKNNIKEKILNQLVKILKEILNEKKGYSKKDIAILVRENKDGNIIAEKLFNEGIEVVSPDSLLLNHSPIIRFIISSLKYLAKKEEISLIEMRYLLPQIEPTLIHKLNSVECRGKRPLIETLEEIIKLFELSKTRDRYGYLVGLLEVVHSYSEKYNTSISGFLDWWDENKDKQSIIVPKGKDAINIMTIHKAKGLQFPIVIIPFPTWKLGLKTSGYIQNLIWVKNNKNLIKNADIDFLVNMTSKIENSYFANVYNEELKKCYIDNINLLYVAFTRAIDRLYILLENPSSKKDLVSKVIFETINNYMISEKHNEFFTRYDNILIMGSPTMKEKDIEFYQTIEIDEYIFNEWRSKLTITRKAKEIWNLESDDKKTRIDKGLIIHQILSKIILEKDIEKSIDEFILSGVIKRQEKPILLDKITKLMNIASENIKVKDWFEEGLSIKTEASILLEDKEIRPDRVIIYPDRIVVIDYKTGKESEDDLKQINEYALTLKDMGYKNIEKYLVYIEVEKIVRV
ncbi:MAG: UvrD-helicase domain-containing protein [Candidatus Hydrogenedentota bacterium]